MDFDFKALAAIIGQRVAAITVDEGMPAYEKPSIAEGHILDPYNEFRTPGSLPLARLHGVSLSY